MKLSKNLFFTKFIMSSLYQFDYCNQCKNLFFKNDTQCSICHTPRFKENSPGPLVNRMNSFFVMRDLKEIQKSLYKGRCILLYN